MKRLHAPELQSPVNTNLEEEVAQDLFFLDLYTFTRAPS